MGPYDDEGTASDRHPDGGPLVLVPPSPRVSLGNGLSPHVTPTDPPIPSVPTTTLDDLEKDEEKQFSEEETSESNRQTFHLRLTGRRPNSMSLTTTTP